MTVNELIEELRKYPENMVVMAHDVEWDEMRDPIVKALQLCKAKGCDPVMRRKKSDDDKEFGEAVVISPSHI